MNNKCAEFSDVILGLGGNIGNVYGNIRDALKALGQSDEIRLVKVSPIYETPPWGIEDQPSFLNLCVQIETSLEAQALLHECQAVETALNRVREVRWGPRTIDLDIILIKDVRVDEPDLTVPHPRIQERAFVLVPLADIAGDWELNGNTVKYWRTQIDDSGITRIYDQNEFDDLIQAQAGH